MTKQRACEHTSYEVRKRWDAENLKKITVALPKDMAAEFKEKCAKDGVPQAQIIKQAIDDFLNNSTPNDKSIDNDVKPAEIDDFAPNTADDEDYIPEWLK